MIAPAILMDYFNETPYLFLQELEGKIKEVSEQELHTLLQKFKTKQICIKSASTYTTINRKAKRKQFYIWNWLF